MKYSKEEVRTQEGKLRPKVDDAEKWEIHRDAIDKRAHDARRAHILRNRVLCELRAQLDGIGMVTAVRLLAGMADGSIAVRLRAEGGVLRRHHHGDAVVDCEDDEHEHHGCHEECLRRGVPFADAEDDDPEEADSQGGDADDGGAEKEEHEKEEDDVVDWEDFAGHDEDPVHGLEDVDVSQNVAAADLAYAVLGLVDARDEHAHPDQQGDNHEQEAPQELDGTEDGARLGPYFHQPGAFTAGFGSEAFAPDERPFVTHEGFEFAPVSGVEASFAAFVAAFELALAFAVLLELGGSVFGEGWCGDGGRRFDEGDWEERKTGGRVDDVDERSEGDEQAERECQRAFAVVLGKQALEVVQVHVLLVPADCAGSDWDEEANEEKNDAEDDEDGRVLERTPQS